MKPTEYAIYLRKSRAEELTDTTEEVLARHRAILEDLADRRNIVVSDVYEEVVSGESLYARTQMRLLLDAVREQKYCAVLCMDIDRLGRGGMADQGTILDAFRDSGTLIITPDKTYNLNDETDEELTEFKAFMARREYKIIRKRMSRGLMQTIQQGGYIANAPYGYRKVRIGKMPSLEIVEDEARFIRHIYDRYCDGVGAHTISYELNALGSVPRRNAQWSRETVREILRNPTYKGMIAWNRVKHYQPGKNGCDKHHVVYMPESEWIMVPGLHPAIISEEQWDRVQKIRTGKYIPSKKTGHIVNPFAGLIVCGNCGYNMQRMVHRGSAYLLCNTKGCCGSTKFENVYDLVLSSMQDRLDRLRMEASGAAPVDTSSDEKLLASYEKELAKLEARIPRLHEFLEDGTYDRATFRHRLDAINAEKNSLLEKQVEAKKRIEIRRSADLTRAADELENALKLFPTLNAEEQNKLLKSVIRKITYYKEKKTKPRDFTLVFEALHFIW